MIAGLPRVIKVQFILLDVIQRPIVRISEVSAGISFSERALGSQWGALWSPLTSLISAWIMLHDHKPRPPSRVCHSIPEGEHPGEIRTPGVSMPPYFSPNLEIYRVINTSGRIRSLFSSTVMLNCSSGYITEEHWIAGLEGDTKQGDEFSPQGLPTDTR